MEPIKAGIEKVKEVSQRNKADEKLEKASDSTVKPGERIDAVIASGNAKISEHEHAVKSDHHKNKHSTHWMMISSDEHYLGFLFMTINHCALLAF